MFPSDCTDNRLLIRSDKLIRLGAALPVIGLGCTMVTARLFEPGRDTFRIVVLGIVALSQLLVWLGLHGVWRGCAWDSGVTFYVWLSALLHIPVVASTGVLVLAPLPVLAPLVATVARWRMRRGAAAGGGGR